MEEVDNIILHTLSQIGCDLEDDVQSLKQFNTDMIVHAVVRCLRVIRNSDDYLQLKLPSNMSARFRLASSIAQTCQELGYRSDIGYQTLLYPNDADVRRLFMFLVEKLPKVTSAADDGNQGGTSFITHEIASKIEASLSLPWLASHCKTHGARWYSQSQNHWMREGNQDSCVFHNWPVIAPEGVGDVTVDIPSETKKFYQEVLPYVTEQPLRRRDIPASLLATNAADLAAESEMDILAEKNFKNDPDNSTEILHEKIKKLIADRLRTGMDKTNISTGNRVSGNDLSKVIEVFSGKSANSTAKGSRFTRSEKLLFAKDTENAASQVGATRTDIGTTSIETQQQQREEEVNSLKTQLEELRFKIKSLEEGSKNIANNILKTDETIENISGEITTHQEIYNIKKKTIDLLPEADKNMAILKKMIANSSQRLIKLTEQWEQHRVPLIEEYRTLKSALMNKEMSETQQKLEDLKIYRKKMKEMAEEAKVKDEVYKQLMSEYKRLNKDVNRSSYTRRIMEIVGNIKKQKDDISKIIEDTKSIQREINLLNGKLERTFAVTDELIFKNAKKDGAGKMAYKQLATIHENFSTLTTIIEETGVISREIRDLEDQIEAISQDNTVASLEQITQDYKQMKHENNSIEAKLGKR
ncbi:uncharacterized protein TRIADDRAFT_30331 [Trichoplax adhaerens]|uniref:Coiled-coil domain-containing protein 22 homolog n=1 Tax=Trichoplax adhaerens TaxID=10228 RepID=B3S6Z6_TRIAD|nr:hypothetical protein TRIADDRAFT_30331 [Trichoplax adhaerens]EDV21397.1 hypothetical protein TRIADDRAFT_30331 [Trichoplax adhaerens]|eukprot:XP_002115997.1 hypothetical protein TRIADDRAFT_30331 [Trichoplax adhaerens]